jgi:sugar-specific transcriptional regulator TrmB
MTASDVLVPFGFTNLESEIYVFLLGESPATGYRIAQAIGKPAANTYKAIQTLQNKGAVLVEEGANRMCRAVPAQELLGRLQNEFERRRSAAQTTLERAGKPAEDERIYLLRSREQVMGRARVMAGSAKSQVLLKCSPELIEDLKAALESAEEHGVDVSILSSRPVVVGNVEAAIAEVGGQLAMVTDGDQYLAGFVDDGKTEAVWTRGAFLTRVGHSGLSAEICLALVGQQLHADEKKSRIVRTLDSRRALP